MNTNSKSTQSHSTPIAANQKPQQRRVPDERPWGERKPQHKIISNGVTYAQEHFSAVKPTLTPEEITSVFVGHQADVYEAFKTCNSLYKNKEWYLPRSEAVWTIFTELLDIPHAINKVNGWYVKQIDDLIRLYGSENLRKCAQQRFAEKIATHHNSDLDGNASMLLLKIAGFTRSHGKQFQHNTAAAWHLNIDSGDKYGIHVSLNHANKEITAAIDQHFSLRLPETVQTTDTSGWVTRTTQQEVGLHGAASSTRILYTFLQKLGRIPHTHKKVLDRFVDFVDLVDCAGNEIISVDNNTERTMLGMHKLLKDVGDIYTYFKEDPTRTWLEVLSDQELEKRTVTQIYQGHKKIAPLKKVSDIKHARITKKEAHVGKLFDAGMFVDFKTSIREKKWNTDDKDKKKVETFLVNIQRAWEPEFTDAFETGYGVISFYPATNDMLVYSPTILPQSWKKFGDIKRGHFLICKNASPALVYDLLKQFQRWESWLPLATIKEKMFAVVAQKFTKKTDTDENIAAAVQKLITKNNQKK
jgi:hypothetical protein